MRLERAAVLLHRLFVGPQRLLVGLLGLLERAVPADHLASSALGLCGPVQLGESRTREQPPSANTSGRRLHVDRLRLIAAPPHPTLVVTALLDDLDGHFDVFAVELAHLGDARTAHHRAPPHLAVRADEIEQHLAALRSLDLGELARSQLLDQHHHARLPTVLLGLLRSFDAHRANGYLRGARFLCRDSGGVQSSNRDDSGHVGGHSLGSLGCPFGRWATEHSGARVTNASWRRRHRPGGRKPPYRRRFRRCVHSRSKRGAPLAAKETLQHRRLPPKLLISAGTGTDASPRAGWHHTPWAQAYAARINRRPARRSSRPPA